MKFFVTAAVIAAALGASAAASAATFDFSYSFTDGQEITGSLDGTLSGTTISNISNISMAFDGTPLTGGVGPLQLVGYNVSTGAYDDSVPGTISTIAAQNNFGIADVDMAKSSTSDYFFTLVNDPKLGGTNALAANFMVTDANSNNPQAFDFTGAGTWKVEPVPLPAALPLLLSGLGLFGIGRRSLGK